MSMLTTLLPFVAMIAVMYFMIIRPQKKQAEEKKSMLDSIQPGDAVVTIGGLNGIVDEVDQANNKVVIDCEGAYLTFELHAIATVKRTVDAEPLEEDEEVDVIDPQDVEQSQA